MTPISRCYVYLPYWACPCKIPAYASARQTIPCYNDSCRTSPQPAACEPSSQPAPAPRVEQNREWMAALQSPHSSHYLLDTTGLSYLPGNISSTLFYYGVPPIQNRDRNVDEYRVVEPTGTRLDVLA
ncbi:hypothetical protein [Rubinisphaera margarita]|uniref:hypothetical protein n=1 Tax=Rubinisphaera margarita TaxID=2909586 RepID=UPI001EE8331C|nr:hypothetical protein [Rubinisphaera margarita]MCG6156959.1 hypothetical protein [Rubinisphaera margarita]